MIITNVNDIKTVKVNKDEQETIISFSRDDEEAEIYTSDNTVLTKLKKKLAKDPKNYLCYEGPKDENDNVTGYFFKCPKKFIRFGTASNRKPLSDSQKQAISDRFKKNKN